MRDIDKLVQRIMSEQSRINAQSALCGVLDPSLSNEYLAIIKTLRVELMKVDDKKDKVISEIVIPYHGMILDSLEASVKLSTAGQKFNPNETFDLLLKTDGLTVADIKNATDVYHREVEKFFALQKQINGIRVDMVPASTELEYHDVVNEIRIALDKHASSLFNKKIITPTNIDLKEKNPHQFLGSINIGYSGIKPDLVRIIAHEGPLGHNTQKLMTSDSGTWLTKYFKHNSEAVAIFGENLGIELFYGKGSPEANIINPLLQSKRRISDSLGAAYEYLAFVEMLPPEKMAKLLASKYVPEERMLEYLKSMPTGRASFSATPYFAGFEKLNEVYEKLSPRAKKIGFNLLERVFTGFRINALLEKSLIVSMDMFEYKNTHTQNRDGYL